MLKSYHHAREALYRQIIADTIPPAQSNTVILDAGCGDVFYGRLLAQVLGPAVTVVALDNHRRLGESRPGPQRVELCQGDMERPGLRPQAFDAVWLCRSLHSAADPPARLQALARLLRPGGRLIVIENDFSHHPMLAWPADFERRVLTAHFLYLEEHNGPGRMLERYHAARYLPAWLRCAALQPAFVHTYVSEDMAPLAPDVEAYWSLFLNWLGRRIMPYLAPEDQRRYLDLCDPASPDYLLAQPAAYCVELTTVGCGVAA